jgi:hypothetical protein
MTRSEITLPALNDSGSLPVYERLAVEEISPNHFRLINSPGLVEGLAAGDEIEIDHTKPSQFNVLRRSGNICVWFFFPGAIDPQVAQTLEQAIGEIGGYLDGGTHSSLIFTIPARVGFLPIEALFSKAEKETSGATWMFANVYDPVDGKTPLNWW